MNTKHIVLAGISIIGLLGTTGIGWAQSGRPSPPQERQDDKNLMRNLGVGLGAIALDSAKKGRIGDALVLGAGAALAGKKYEDARVAQRDESRYRRDDRYNTEAYDRDRFENNRYPSRWERERLERERQERAERERRERFLRERIERERQERLEQERRECILRERREREREERLRWERRDRDRDRDHNHDSHDRDRGRW